MFIIKILILVTFIILIISDLSTIKINIKKNLNNLKEFLFKNKKNV